MKADEVAVRQATSGQNSLAPAKSRTLK